MLQSAQVIKYDAAKRQTPQDWSVKDPDKVWVPTKIPCSMPVGDTVTWFYESSRDVTLTTRLKLL